MRDTNKGFMAVKVKNDTYKLLKDMAVKNNCSLSALIHEAVSKLTPDDAGNIYNKVARIEQHLHDMDGQWLELNSHLSQINVKDISGASSPVTSLAGVPLVPMMSHSIRPYLNDKELTKQNKEDDEMVEHLTEQREYLEKLAADGDKDVQFLLSDNAARKKRASARHNPE